MTKVENYKLDNGLNLVFYQDNTKHMTVAKLFVKFGGNNKEFKINNKKYKIKDGTAHFMEHLLLENSIYGNMINEFAKNHTISNGLTNKINTEFYINCIYGFEEELIKLIECVNISNFNRENIENTRPSIIKEKMMEKDNNFSDLLKIDYECLFNKIEFSNTIGEIEDIKSISYDELKICYDTFYQPNNQILVIAGNFNKKKIKKLVEDTYKKINKKNIDFEIDSKKEKDEVNINEKEIEKNINIPYVRINYKINVSNFNNYERIKLSFYTSYFFNYLFSPSSYVYTKLVRDKICTYNIDYSCEDLEEYLVIRIGTYTERIKDFIKEIKNTVYKKELNKDNFELQKKRAIINIILREDSLFGILTPFIDNIITFKYYDIDKIEDIESQNFDDYEKIINSLDFSNYCITKMIKKSKK